MMWFHCLSILVGEVNLSHQGAESPPGGLSHSKVIENAGEDGSLLSPVDLQGARPQNLHPVHVQWDSQVVGDLAPD